MSKSIATVADVRRVESAMLANLAHVKKCKQLIKVVVGAASANAPDPEVCVASVHALRRFFVGWCKTSKKQLEAGNGSETKRKSKKQRRIEAAERAALRGAGVEVEEDAGAATEATSATEKVRQWVRGQYRRFLARLAALLFTGTEVQQVLAVRTLMTCIAVDGPLISSQVAGTTFGHASMLDLVQAILAADEALPPEVLAVLREEYLNIYHDVRCYMLNALTSALASKAGNPTKEGELSVSDSAAQAGAGAGAGATAGSDEGAGLDGAASRAAKLVSANAMELLLQVHLSPGATDAEDMEMLSTPVKSAGDGEVLSGGDARGVKRARSSEDDADDDAGSSKLQTPSHHMRAFGKAWMALLRRPLSPLCYRKALLILPSRVIPCMINPLVLSDFLTDSYNLGGVASVLSLQALFDLIMKHNLDYPDFFAKLYLLLQPSVLHTKYRARFLRLLGVFLASPLMPTYIVASYAKRLSWLALHGSPASGLYVCALVYNLLQRHPTCIPMIQRRRKSASVAAQGNAAFTPPPTLSVDSRIIKSSLYELTGLRSHYCPALASMASVFEKALNKAPYNLSEFASQTYQDLFDIEASRGAAKIKRSLANTDKSKPMSIATNFRPVPSTVFFGDDTFKGCFAVPTPGPVELPPLVPEASGEGDGDSVASSSGDEDEGDAAADVAADGSASGDDSGDSDSDDSEESSSSGE